MKHVVNTASTMFEHLGFIFKYVLYSVLFQLYELSFAIDLWLCCVECVNLHVF